MPLFNRDISVDIQTKSKLIVIDNLRIDFTCVKTNTNDMNTCDLQIYNLSENTISLFKNTDLNIVVKAGYKDYDGKEVIFKGNTTKIYTQYNKPDKITNIKIEDGEKELNKATSSLSFKEGIDLKTILKKCAKDLNLPLKFLIDKIDFNNKKFNNGFSFSGKTKTSLDQLSKIAGLLWSVQNQELTFYKPKKSNSSFIIKLTSKNGIIGSPEKIKIKDSKDSKKNSGIDGWRINNLLRPKIEPGNILSIFTRDIPEGSLFIVKTIIHTGSKYTNTFNSMIEVIKYE